MNDAQKKIKLKKLATELEQIHAEYMERYEKLRKKQTALLKKVNARLDALKISELSKEIKKKRAK